jgi:hypothetical protein
MTIPTKEQELSQITKDTLAICKKIGTIQDGVHELLIKSTLYTFKYRGEVDVIAKILNSLSGVRGSFRVESVAYWYSQVAGIESTYNKSKDKYECSLVKDKRLSDLGIPFTYDAPHLALCKLDANRFWKVAPVILKDLKLPGDVEKATQSAEIMLARALAGNSITEEEIKAHLANMFDRVRQLSTNGKTKEWLNSYYLQHPESKPGEVIDTVDAEIEALFEADRIAALGLSLV